jgi:8-oxo-dGTP pyrophosphatase MutT (NUDIX family)
MVKFIINSLFMLIVKQTKACGIIIFRDDISREYLLVEQSQSGLWNFPKGHVENSENEHETALRETLEETGLNVKIIDGFRETISYDESKDAHKTVVMFIGKPLNMNVCIQKEEISDYSWLSFEDGLKKIKFNNSRVLLRKAEKFISNLH